MDLGFYMAEGFRFLLANDVLPAPALTYSKNFNHSIVCVGEISNIFNGPVYLVGDIAEIDFEGIKKPVDVLIGGPPCQDFSVVRGPAQERRGIEVRRGRLYAHFIRALIHLQPKVFVFENVPGLKSANKGLAYRTILEDFSSLNLRWREIRELVGNGNTCTPEDYNIVFSEIVDSSRLGVPQKRRRLIIIGVRKDLFESNIMKYHTLKDRVVELLKGVKCSFATYPLTPLEVFEGKPLPDLKNEYRKVMEEYKELAEHTNFKELKKWVENTWSSLSLDVVEDYLRINNVTEYKFKFADKAFEEHEVLLKKLGYYGRNVERSEFADGSNRNAREAEKVLERMKMIPPDQNCEFVRGTEWEVEGRGLSLIYRRLHPLKPSYTVVAYGGGGTWGYHYRIDRARLTNRERARLQTFPDFYSFEGTTAEVRAQIGEAVPPILGEKIAEAVKLLISV